MSDPEKRERFDKEAHTLAATLAAGLISRVPEIRSVIVLIDWHPGVESASSVMRSTEPLTVETLTGMIKRNADLAVSLAQLLRDFSERKSDDVKPTPDNNSATNGG